MPDPAPPDPDRLSVLLVDDQQAFLDAASVILGADARLRIMGTASSGPEALRLVARQAPAIVLLDVQMPAMNGFEAARAIRGLVHDVHIVFVSSDDEPAYASLARRLGDGFIAKSRLSAQAVLDLVGAPPFP
jgi:DNA-binding NarL/FixJ family response regulator